MSRWAAGQCRRVNPEERLRAAASVAHQTVGKKQTGAPVARPRAAPLMIGVQGLEKTYPNGTRAVRGVDFQVQKGEVFGILGPNGAGKSTIIGILGTLVRPTAGHVSIDGLEVHSHPLSVRRKIGFAMQEAGVDELATGWEYLILQARLYGIDKRTAATRAEELLEVFELTQARNKRIGGYSGGMKRRIDLAAAMIHVPPLLFLDEPSEGLDPRSRDRLWNVLEHLNEELGTTILLSTHYMEEADRLCDRLAILDEGRIVAQGTPGELKASVGGQSVLLEYGEEDTGQAQRAERALAGMQEVERLQRTEKALHVYVQDAAAATPAILRTLDRAQAAPMNLRIRQPTLNDVYLKYTGRRYGEEK